MYANFEDNKIYGYGLKKNISKTKIDRSFINRETKQLINYKIDDDLFLKPLVSYDNQKFILKIFGGSTSFCNEVNQEDSLFEKSLSNVSRSKNKIYYKNYSIPGHNLLHDLYKLKYFALSSFPKSESIFIFNYGWNEEFISSAYPQSLNNNRPLNRIETNFIYQKNIILSLLCKNYTFARLVKYFTNRRFSKLMDFYRTERWSNFIKNNYVNYWLKNFEKNFDIILNKKAIILNNPGLAQLSDNDDTINFIIENSRLDKKYHLYQSLCLEINSIVNRSVAEYFDLPFIDINNEFKALDGKKRSELFLDEIHLSKKGHDYASKLIENKITKIEFEKLKNVKKKCWNTLKDKIFNEIKFILEIANREIYKNHSSVKKNNFIPSDRYPSYRFE